LFLKDVIGVSKRSDRCADIGAFPGALPNLRRRFFYQRHPRFRSANHCLDSFEAIVPSRCANAAGVHLLLTVGHSSDPASVQDCAGWSFFAFDRARSFAIYNDTAFEAIILMKYEEVTRLGQLVCGAACRMHR
jgi:hypothetical protein